MASHNHQIEMKDAPNHTPSLTRSACEKPELRMRIAATKTRSKKRSSHACSDSGEPGRGPGAGTGSGLVGILFCSTSAPGDRGVVDWSMPDRPSDAAESLGSLPPGTRVPAETDPHERTLIAWPTEERRDQLWGDQLDAAREVHALLAHAIARFEPVLLVADPSEAEAAAAHIDSDRIEVLAAPIDDSWLRDSGPVIAVAPDGTRRALCFEFTGWGGSFEPFDRDATIAARLAAHLGLRAYDIGIAGRGRRDRRRRQRPRRHHRTVPAQPQPQPGAQPGRDRRRAAPRDSASDTVLWLADGIAEDEGTDGHVDNVVAFFAPGRCLLQGCADPANPNHDIAPRAGRCSKRPASR